jgi:type IV pilus assembly protein PilC
MPSFRYSATDKSGTSVDGILDAPTADDALLQLVNQGLMVNQIMKSFGPAAAAPKAEPQAKPQATPDPPRPVIKPIQPQPVRSQTPAPVATLVTQTPDPVQIIRTRRASNKDRLFLFSQLAKQLKAGIGPAESLDNLKSRVPKFMADSLDDASKHAISGRPMSDAFEKYPDLYPEHVVGTLRAAEVGGFLPEGCDLISDQAMNAHSFNRWFWWVGPMVINAVIAIPLALLVMKGLIAAYDTVDKQGQSATAASTSGALAQGIFKMLLWPVGPITLAIWLIIIFFTKWLRSAPATRVRHEIAFRWPLFGKRAKHECLSVFSWVMSKVANAGVSPHKAWQLAACSVPNLAIKERLLRIGNGMGGAEKLSDAVFREKLFPNEYAPVIAVAEHTGDMPGAFDQLFRISQVEFDASQTHARDRSARWGCAASMAVSGIILIILTWYFYNVLFAHVLSGLDQ